MAIRGGCCRSDRGQSFILELYMKAFPTHAISVNDQARVTSIGGEGGMDLRDYFAAKAMQGFVSSVGIEIDFFASATDAYAVADAMLKAREA
jgi:hypothetical protein